jgi:hypothetical protein
MLATFGLDRIEAALTPDAVSPADVAAFVEQARADCAKPAARTGAEQSYPLLDEVGYLDHFAERILGDPARGEATRVFVHHESNPEFQPTRHAHRV